MKITPLRAQTLRSVAAHCVIHIPMIARPDKFIRLADHTTVTARIWALEDAKLIRITWRGPIFKRRATLRTTAAGRRALDSFGD